MDSNKINEEITNIQEDIENTEIIEPVEELTKENPY